MRSVFTLMLLAMLASACVVVSPVRTSPGRAVGPPPHAPAHGYRHKLARYGVDLVFDSGLGVYVVVGLDDVYFYGDRFYRWRDSRWFVSSEPRSGFVVVASGDLPTGLAKKSRAGGAKGKGHKGKNKGHGKGPGAAKAKGRYE